MKQIYLFSFLVFILVVVLFWFNFYCYEKTKTIETIKIDILPRLPLDVDSEKEIPKIIWTFWHSNDLPTVVYKCIETWRKTNPDYDIHIVTKDNLSFYLPENNILSYPHCGRDNIQRASDFIRLQLIYKYGGFWVDASIILHGSLNYFRNIQTSGGYEFLGYYLDYFTKKKEYPVIESWFFAAVKKSEIIKLWIDCFSQINSFSKVEDYIKWVQENLGVDTQNINSLSYLSIHVACQHMLQKKLSQEQIQNYIYLEKAEDGPFKYLEENEWNSTDALLAACKNKDLQTLVFKMRGKERNVIQEDPRLLCVFGN